MFRAHSGMMLAITLLAYPSMHLFASPPRTDVYGDSLPEGVRVRMGTIQLRHPFADVTFSADGRTLISCGQDGLVRHWSLASGRLVREMQLRGSDKTLIEVGFCSVNAEKTCIHVQYLEFCQSL